jgi:tetratricopeptide (TPR) repeat protein
MTKIGTLFRRDSVLYALLFIIWAVIIFIVNGRYTYFGNPFPGVDLSAQQSPAQATRAMADTIARQEQLLGAERNAGKRGLLLEKIGTTYFQLYGFSRKQTYLDSAYLFCEKAARENAKASSVYYMLGRIMGEKKDFASAKAQFEKVLSLDSTFPMVNYMLGEISLEKNDHTSALRFYENETRHFLARSTAQKNTAVDPADIRMAACFSSLRLAFLYSTSFVDAQKAQDRFNLYMKLETDPQRRQNSQSEIQKYWKTNQAATTPR